VTLLVVASFLDGWAQGALWALARALVKAGAYFLGAEGWRVMPEQLAERHGLFLIIALGESIVAIGIGAEAGVTAGVIAAAVVGIALAAGQWWAYFDVVALVAARRLASTSGREQNEIARDSYSYLHFPMIAGIVLIALAEKKTLGHTSEPLKIVPAFALLGGLAMYLLAHVAFRYRNIHSLNTARLVTALIYLALLPVAVEVPALTISVIATALFCALIAYEAIRFSDARDRIRHELAADLAPPEHSRAQTF
jgi:low temperature requirement protein LtrA